MCLCFAFIFPAIAGVQGLLALCHQDKVTMAGGRRLAWRRDEVLDLLSVWGGRTIQAEPSQP